MAIWNDIVQLQKDFIKAITPETGTTTSSFETAVDMDTRWLGETVITIANTGLSNSLDYEVLVYNDYKNGIYYKTTTGTILLSDSDQIILERHARIMISVKSTGAGHTTYQIDAIGGR